MHEESRRKLLKAIAVGGGAVAVGKILPVSWSRPFAGFGILPAHAQTSEACTDTPLRLSGEINWETDLVGLTINPGFDGAAGGSSIGAGGDFAGTLFASGGNCANGQPVTQDGTFSGNLNPLNGAVSGTFTHRILCGGVVICTSSGAFSGTAVFDSLEPVSISGVVSSCCPDPTPIFG